jgi:hypothetical protein
MSPVLALDNVVVLVGQGDQETTSSGGDDGIHDNLVGVSVPYDL